MSKPVGKRWQANAIVDGVRKRPTFDTKEEADAFEANPKAETVSPQVGVMFRHGFETLWRRTKNETKVFGITEELIRRLGETTRVNTITSARVQDLQAELLRCGNGEQTVNRKMSALSKLLKHAHTRGAISALPAIRYYKAKVGRTRFLSKAEELAIIAPLTPHFRALANFLLYTGCRYGEAEALQWQDVGAQVVTFWDTKANRPRSVPLLPEARLALTVVQQMGKAKPFGWIDYNSFHTAWTRSKAKAGLREDNQVVPHILRHTCASRLVQGGVDIVRVSKWLGHEDIKVTMKYAHLAPHDLMSVAHILSGSVSGTQEEQTGGFTGVDIGPIPVPNSAVPDGSSGLLVP